MSRYSIVVTLSLMIVFAGCASAAPPTPTRAPTGTATRRPTLDLKSIWTPTPNYPPVLKTIDAGAEVKLKGDPLIRKLAISGNYLVSPDGQWVAFTGNPRMGLLYSTDVYVMRLDGSEIVRVSRTLDAKQVREFWIEEWTTDSSFLMFTASFSNGTVYCVYDVAHQDQNPNVFAWNCSREPFYRTATPSSDFWKE